MIKKQSKKRKNLKKCQSDTGVPDLENESIESDKTEDEIEIQDNARPDLRQKETQILVI